MHQRTSNFNTPQHHSFPGCLCPLADCSLTTSYIWSCWTRSKATALRGEYTPGQGADWKGRLGELQGKRVEPLWALPVHCYYCCPPEKVLQKSEGYHPAGCGRFESIPYHHCCHDEGFDVTVPSANLLPCKGTKIILFCCFLPLWSADQPSWFAARHAALSSGYCWITETCPKQTTAITETITNIHLCAPG